jgi:hypothetical protein
MREVDVGRVLVHPLTRGGVPDESVGPDVPQFRVRSEDLSEDGPSGFVGVDLGEEVVCTPDLSADYMINVHTYDSSLVSTHLPQAEGLERRYPVLCLDCALGQLIITRFSFSQSPSPSP